MRGEKGRPATLILLGAGIALIVTGLVLGQNAAVLKKAIRICTECIGLG